MPFTFAHPALVLPFNYLSKKRISLTGLITGSITPDFEYFLRMQKTGTYSHTWAGLLGFDVPVGLLLTFIYYGIVHKSLIDHLPLPLKARALRYRDFNWIESFKKKWFVILLCILVGATSHVLWDSYTLLTMVRLDNNPSVRKYLATIQPDGMSYYFFWSIVSGIGGLIVAYAFYQLPVDKAAEKNKYTVRFWATVACTALLVFMVRLIIGGLSVMDGVVSAIAATMIALILTSLVFRYKART